MNKKQAYEMAEAFGIGKCLVCGIVTSEPEKHCRQGGTTNERTKM